MTGSTLVEMSQSPADAHNTAEIQSELGETFHASTDECENHLLVSHISPKLRHQRWGRKAKEGDFKATLRNSVENS